jgi:Tfp pilus assembly protein FimT
MKTRTRQYGLSLTEILTTLMIIVLLAAMSMPAVNAIFNSLGSAGSCEAMINAALSNARAIAMREQRYAGVRFQKAYNSGDVLGAKQYMIFIVQDYQNTGLANGFRAAEGMKPIRLPENIRVTDLTVNIAANGALNSIDSGNVPVLNDISTFSIVFSPQGNLIIHPVQVRNKDGQTNNTSLDDIFNTQTNVENLRAMFYQDYYPGLGLDKEMSRRQFLIYEQDKFKSAYERGQAYSGYLKSLLDSAGPTYINSYTGTIISTD